MVHTSEMPRRIDLCFPGKADEINLRGNRWSGYNLVGSLTSETYPSGRVVNTCYNTANEVVQVGLGACSTTGGAYVSGVLYAQQGKPGSYTYGNQLASTRTYNNRLQPSGFTNTAGSTALLSATLDRGTSNNNGNLLNSTYIYNGGAGLSNPLTLKQSYTYDGVNRLLGVTDTGYTRTFGYDPYGNSYVSNATGIAPLPNTPASPGLYDTNNQLTSGSYDTAGNEISVNGNTITYDAESHQVNVVGMGVNETYAYDGDGKRVGKLGNSGVPTTVFVYDAMGRMAAEYSTAVASSPCVTCYLSTDDFGTVRLITSESDSVVARHDDLPFGEEVLANTAGRNGQWGTGNDPINQKFTGKERDSESGLDYFGARYYGSALGRFSSPDPAFESEILELPQTWNRYTYVYNRPLSITDPDGRCPPCVGAIIGGVVEGGWNLGSQLYQNGGDLGQVSWSEVGANAAGGAVTGAIAGATAGGSLLADALIGAGANVAGGIVTRTVKGDDRSDIVAPGDVATDAVAGLVGGGAGHLAADLVHVPEEPGSLGMRRHAVGRRKLAKYDAAAARKSAIGVQVGIGAAAGSPPFHGTASFINNFWGVVDWLIFTPENREPKACVSVSDSASGSHFGGCGN